MDFQQVVPHLRNLSLFERGQLYTGNDNPHFAEQNRKKTDASSCYLLCWSSTKPGTIDQRRCGKIRPAAKCPYHRCWIKDGFSRLSARIRTDDSDELKPPRHRAGKVERGKATPFSFSHCYCPALLPGSRKQANFPVLPHHALLARSAGNPGAV